MSKNIEEKFKLYSLYVKEQIKKSGLSYPIIENELHWKPQTLNQMLNQNRSIKASDLKKLADLLNEDEGFLIDPDYLPFYQQLKADEAAEYRQLKADESAESASGDSREDILKRVKMIEDAVNLFDVEDYCIISTDKREIELLKQLYERISTN